MLKYQKYNKQITNLTKKVEDLEKRIKRIEITLSELKLSTKNNEEKISQNENKALGENKVNNCGNEPSIYINKCNFENLGYDFF